MYCEVRPLVFCHTSGELERREPTPAQIYADAVSSWRLSNRVSELSCHLEGRKYQHEERSVTTSSHRLPLSYRRVQGSWTHSEGSELCV